jgi:hypothetical protein
MRHSPGFIRRMDLFQGQDQPLYEFSSTFSLLNRGNDLYKVLSIVKTLGQSLAVL